jgi:hypothetical protein
MTDTAPSPGILILPDEMAAHKADLIDALAQLMPNPPTVELESEFQAECRARRGKSWPGQIMIEDADAQAVKET